METLLSEAEEQRYAELQMIALESARAGQTEVLESMLAAGLPPNLADAQGQTLLILASYHGHLETTRVLLQRGADVDRRNRRGQTALGGVAFKGEVEIAALLLEFGAQLQADQGSGLTPPMLAKMFGRERMVEMLNAAAAGAALGGDASTAQTGQRSRLGLWAGWLAGRVLAAVRRG